jgi:hypothetical protein
MSYGFFGPKEDVYVFVNVSPSKIKQFHDVKFDLYADGKKIVSSTSLSLAFPNNIGPFNHGEHTFRIVGHSASGEDIYHYIDEVKYRVVKTQADRVNLVMFTPKRAFTDEGRKQAHEMGCPSVETYWAYLSRADEIIKEKNFIIKTFELFKSIPEEGMLTMPNDLVDIKYLSIDIDNRELIINTEMKNISNRSIKELTLYMYFYNSNFEDYKVEKREIRFNAFSDGLAPSETISQEVVVYTNESGEIFPGEKPYLPVIVVGKSKNEINNRNMLSAITTLSEKLDQLENKTIALQKLCGKNLK